MMTSDSNQNRSTRKWDVHRQDDNGNHFVTNTGLSREDAEQIVAEFEAHKHKQAYWLEPSQETVG
jgi:hypothetical protein